MKTLLNITAMILCAVLSINAQSYSRAIFEYEEGNITSDQLIKIIDGGNKEPVSHLDRLAEEYIQNYLNEDLNNNIANATLFPGVDRIIGGFVQKIKDDKLRKMLGFIFPSKKCDSETLLIRRGIEAFKEDYNLIGKPIPAAILKVDEKYNGSK